MEYLATTGRETGKGEPEPELRGPPRATLAARAPAVPRRPQRLIDAWYGSYGTPVSAALLRRDDNVARLVAETVFADDDRQQIQNTQDFPWVCLCWLVITGESGNQFIGTGWLAGPRTVITAGHCVYLHNEGGWAQQIQVYPARNGNQQFGEFTSSNLHSTVGWTEQKSEADDYGAIVLADGQTDWMGYEAADDDTLQGLLVNVTGYPGDKENGTLWGSTRRLVGATDRQLTYDISTFGGQSGSPVFYKDGENRWVIGIHNYGGASANTATRITSQVFDDIEAWKKEGGS
jgi:V8-like Glu-specific endopeptidase